MVVTPFSKRPYYPYLLANGNDVVLINYSGSMVDGLSGHIHAEQNQGTVCAWHKVEHRTQGVRIPPILLSYYNVFINGEACVVRWYEQEFDPRRAILTTRVKFPCNTEVKVETFLSSRGILVYEIEVLKSEADSMDVAFFLAVPHGSGIATPNTEIPESEFIMLPEGIDFTYSFKKNNISGRASMRSDRKDGVGKYDISRPCVRFENVKAGWKGMMFTSCADAPGEPAEPTEDLKEKHIAEWEEYFSRSDIRLPDPEIQYSYELGRYMARAGQHSKGAIPCGLLPHMWAGGTVVPCDAEFVFQGMLQSNNVAEARKYLQFYLDRYEKGEQLVAELGMKGVAFSNWSNVKGEHCLGRSLKDELTHRKHVMIAIIGIAAGQYLLYADPEDTGAKKLLHGCADFMSCFVLEDGKLPPCAAQNESYVDVERDSFLLAVTHAVLKMDGAINNDPVRKKVAENLREQILLNRDDKGVILPWKDAKYYSAMPLWAQHYCPGLHSVQELKILHEASRTPWGTDGEQPSEVTRHWSWDNPLYAREFIRAGVPEKAFPLLESWFDYSAATGAVPEQIRLDGYVIGYWYPTPYGAFLQAISEAFGRIEGDKLYLLQGFDGKWQDLTAENLRLEGGYLLSISVEKGKVTAVSLVSENSSKEFEVVLNPAYGKLPNNKMRAVLL